MTATGNLSNVEASNRATQAAASTLIALFDPKADTNISGKTIGFAAPPGSLPRRARPDPRIAGEIFYNVEQNADRRLPSGGNTGRRYTR